MNDTFVELFSSIDLFHCNKREHLASPRRRRIMPSCSSGRPHISLKNGPKLDIYSSGTRLKVLNFPLSLKRSVFCFASSHLHTHRNIHKIELYSKYAQRFLSKIYMYTRIFIPLDLLYILVASPLHV